MHRAAAERRGLRGLTAQRERLSGPTSQRRGISGLIGVAAAVSLVAAAPGVASAAVVTVAGAPGVAYAASTWTIQSVPPPAGSGGGELSGISCPTSSFCVATDTGGAADGPYSSPAVEVWNGSTWSGQALPVTPESPDGFVTAVSCASAASCTAIGYYPPTDGGELPMSEEWNGSSWTPETMPGGLVTAVSCASATRCLAVGHDNADLWNGSDWKAVAAPVQPSGSEGVNLSGVSCVTGVSCTAAGESVTDGGDGGFPLAEQWNGSGWELQDVPPPAGGAYGYLNGVSCLSPSSCFAAGDDFVGSAPATSAPLGERWSDGSWQIVATPLPSGDSSGELEGISCAKTTAGTGECVAVGVLMKSSSTLNRTMAEYWNGRRWAYQATAAPSQSKELFAVSCVAGSTCTAVGEQTDQGRVGMLAEQN